jgi:arylsulfatase A-like enzyme
MKRPLISLLTSLGLALGAAAAPPNIILILTDDQGWSMLSEPMHPDVPESAISYFHTPAMNRLAREGMRFTSGYSPGPQCTPTRRSIQNGMTPARQRGTEFKSAWVPAAHLTIPRALKQAEPAYACAHFGKWGEDIYEGGIRVPFIVRGPGVKAGSVCHEPVAGYDLLPTFYELAGGADPLPADIDGAVFARCSRMGAKAP